MKTPFAAFLIVESTCLSSGKPSTALFLPFVRIDPVRVEEIDKAAGRARVAKNTGGNTEDTRWVRFEHLATTPAAVLAKVEKYLSPLLARAPLNAMAVTTAGAEENSILQSVAANHEQNPDGCEQIHHARKSHDA